VDGRGERDQERLVASEGRRPDEPATALPAGLGHLATQLDRGTAGHAEGEHGATVLVAGDSFLRQAD
jgi:hypothetical protein